MSIYRVKNFGWSRLDRGGGNLDHPTFKKKYGTSYNKTIVFGFDVGSTIIHMTFYVKKIGKKMTVTIFKMIRKVKKRSRLPLSTVSNKWRVGSGMIL